MRQFDSVPPVEIVILATRRPCACGAPAGAPCPRMAATCAREREQRHLPDDDGTGPVLPISSTQPAA